MATDIVGKNPRTFPGISQEFFTFSQEFVNFYVRPQVQCNEKNDKKWQTFFVKNENKLQNCLKKWKKITKILKIKETKLKKKLKQKWKKIEQKLKLKTNWKKIEEKNWNMVFLLSVDSIVANMFKCWIPQSLTMQENGLLV